MRTKAMPVSGGIVLKNDSYASRPPAEAPIPTIGKLFFRGCDLETIWVESVFFFVMKIALPFVHNIQWSKSIMYIVSSMSGKRKYLKYTYPLGLKSIFISSIFLTALPNSSLENGFLIKDVFLAKKP